MRSIFRSRRSEVPRWFSQYVMELNPFCPLFTSIKIVTFCQDWIANNVTPPKEVVGSLAIQMNQRALDQERVCAFSLLFSCSIVQPVSRLDTRGRWRKQNERKSEPIGLLKNWTNRYKQMRSVNSWPKNNSTKLGNGPIQRLPKFLSWEKETFKSLPKCLVMKSRSTVLDSTLSACFILGVVNLPPFFFPFSFHWFSPQAGLGIVYTADPIVDEIVSMSPLELYIVTFESQYYTTTQGRKKLKQVEQEIQRLSTVRHPKLLSVYAVKLHIPHSSGPPQLMVLSEQLPALTLHDLLEDSECLREDRVSVCMFFFSWISLTHYSLGLPESDFDGTECNSHNRFRSQRYPWSSALCSLCWCLLLLTGINARCVGLVSSDSAGQSKVIKLGKVAYHTRLLDLHRSDSFGPHTPIVPDEYQVPEAW